MHNCSVQKIMLRKKNIFYAPSDRVVKKISQVYKPVISTNSSPCNNDHNNNNNNINNVCFAGHCWDVADVCCMWNIC